jgi:serine/threonine protein kinase
MILITQGVVHRDIKVQNIVYESSNQDKVKLIDLGLCTLWKEATDLHTYWRLQEEMFLRIIRQVGRTSFQSTKYVA